MLTPDEKLPSTSKTAKMERYLLRWINDTQLVEASDTHLRCYNREGQLLASKPEGAKLLAYNPATDVVRYLVRPKEEGENCTFLDWHWQTGAIEDIGWGSIWTHCCAFDGKGNFAHGGDWEDGGYWGGIDSTGQTVGGASSMPVLCSMAFSPDGSRLLLGGRWHYLAIWPFGPESRRAEKTFEVPGGIVNAVAWSDSGTYVAALSTLQRLMVWDLQLGFSVANMPAPANRQLSHHHMRFVPGAEHLVWISTDSCVQLINWRRRVVVHHIRDCRAFDVSPSGLYVAYRREGESGPVVVELGGVAEKEETP